MLQRAAASLRSPFNLSDLACDGVLYTEEVSRPWWNAVVAEEPRAVSLLLLTWMCIVVTAFPPLIWC
jgi:hypothetical protein